MKKCKALFLIILCLLLGLGCSQTNFGGTNLTNAVGAGTDVVKAVNLSDDDVVKLALQYATYSDQQNKLAPASSVYNTRLNKLTAKIGHEDGLKLNFKVYMNPEPNAFSLADGSIRVHS